MGVFIGSDHAGFWLKRSLAALLEKKGYKVHDTGPYAYNPEDDYPDYAAKACRMVLKSHGKGILICGSGQGMVRTANKIKGIYAALCWNERSAEVSRLHGDVNVLCMGSDFVTEGMAFKIAVKWLETEFSNEARHIRRIRKIRYLERGD